MIKETKNYKLEVVVDTAEDGVDRQMYGVVNKDTGVVEASVSLLPQALLWLGQIQEKLDAAMKGDDPQLTVLSFDKH